MILMRQSFSLPMSRRSFAKLMGAAVAGTLLGNDMGRATAAAHPAAVPGFSGKGLPVLYDSDVCVVGGGAAGTAAAVNAARRGAKVVLVERGILLGGLQTLGCVYPCMPTFVHGSDTPYINELNKRMEKQGASPLLGVDAGEWFYGDGKGLYAPEVLSLVYEEMCGEAGVEILYDASLVGAVTENGRIKECVVHTVEGLGKVRAKTFIDATGDAALARYAGVPVEKGSEETGRNQPMSLRFEMTGVDVEKVFHFFDGVLQDERMSVPLKEKFQEDVARGCPPYLEFAKIPKNEHFFKEAVARGDLTEDDILYIQGFSIIGKPHTMSLNCPEMPPLAYSSTDAVSRSKAVSFGRLMMHRLADFFIKRIPGFEKAYISREASMLGVRESWRIRGKYYLDAEDYFETRHFADAICRTAYPIDIHDVKLNVSKKIARDAYYEIPYRALVTNEIENLIVAGRCISGSFAAQASFRIQPTCMSMGEAAGIAAAWGLRNKVAANNIQWDKLPAGERSYVSEDD